MWLRTPYGFYINRRKGTMDIQTLVATLASIQPVLLAVLIVFFTIMIIRMSSTIDDLKKAQFERHFLSSNPSGDQNEALYVLNKRISELHPILIPDACPGVDDLVGLAESYWHFKNSIEKEEAFSNGNNAKSAKSYLRQIGNYLDKNNIEIVDYEIGKKYNEGLNVSVTFVEEETASTPYIQKVLNPGIVYCGALYRKANVIVARNSRKD